MGPSVRLLCLAVITTLSCFFLFSCNSNPSTGGMITLEEIDFLKTEERVSEPDHLKNIDLFLETMGYSRTNNKPSLKDEGFTNEDCRYHYIGFVSGYDIYFIEPPIDVLPAIYSYPVNEYILVSGNIYRPSEIGLYGFKDNCVYLLEDLFERNELDVDYLFINLLPNAPNESLALYYEGSQVHIDHFSDYYSAEAGERIDNSKTRFFYLGKDNGYLLYLILPDVKYAKVAALRKFNKFTLSAPFTGTVSAFNIYGYKDGQYAAIEELLSNKEIDPEKFFNELLPLEFGGKKDYYYN